MIEKNIFNKKFLRAKIDRYSLRQLDELKKKQDIVSRWNYSISNLDILNTKEKSLQGKFLRDFFCDILGYTEFIGNDRWTLIQEEHTKIDQRTPDAILGNFTSAIKDVQVVIELKDANTNLDMKQNRKGFNLSPVEQAFMYAPKYGSRCKWIIVSNFIEIRLYHSSNQLEYELFLIEDLKHFENFKRFYYVLNEKNLIGKDKNSVIDDLFTKNQLKQKNISNQFYKMYRETRLSLFQMIKFYNSDIEDNIILEKTQKLMDRFIFICFCEDMGLLEVNTFNNIIILANMSYEMSDNLIWNQLKGLFHSIDKGNERLNINRFNGGLFARDEILDAFTIPDHAFKGLEEIAEYDFETELNVNILGHIFEQSISDLEELKKQIENTSSERISSKRKNDGIYYTPESITNYMVNQSIGQWLEEKKCELGIYDLPDIPPKTVGMSPVEKRNRTIILKKHINIWQKYSNILTNIKVLDPACGSGAFLIAAFDFLYKEGQMVNEKLANIRGGQVTIFDLDKRILRNNLYGVDINKESVEITKLSLWLKTANKNKPLTSLDENIKCGNSLKNNEFDWKVEFSGIFDEGGFDVIIGNPPYGAKLSKEDKLYYKEFYLSAKSASKGSTDTFSLFIELALNICKNNAIINFIVPLSITSSESMQLLHSLLLQQCSEITISSYSNRPTKIFEQADQRLSIICCKKDCTPTKLLQTTTVNKRYAEVSIQEMLDSLEFINSYEFIQRGRFPKIGKQIELDILKKMFKSTTTLKDLYDCDGNPIYYRTSGGRYYNIITNFETKSSKEKSILIRKEYSDFVGALLSSSLYFWFYHIYSNNLDLKTYELEMLPIPIHNINMDFLKKINELYTEYINDLKENSRKVINELGEIEYKEFYARKSKLIIDQIDYILKELYEFTENEINFIINFDSKFRM